MLVAQVAAVVQTSAETPVPPQFEEGGVTVSKESLFHMDAISFRAFALLYCVLVDAYALDASVLEQPLVGAAGIVQPYGILLEVGEPQSSRTVAAAAFVMVVELDTDLYVQVW